ncbi:MAG: histidine-type phosphatase, partial [Muribaculaceae bacterium]|nr:histidine-type phosphatase [Muribaculaceae bacterium]
LGLTDYVAQRAHNYWGALDSLCMAEQRGIASRMFINYPELFINGNVSAISSYSPRCVMSMYSFTHQLDRLNNKVEIITSAGRQNSQLMRPFDLNKDYLDFMRSKVWETPWSDYADTRITAAPLRRVLGKDYPLTLSETRSLAIDEYHFLGGLSAMSIDVDLSEFLSIDEINAMWSVYNLRQYLQRTASVLSSVPADIASPLVLDLIRTTDEAVAGNSDATVRLRFGHAETLLPLFSLLRLRGAYYLTNYYDTVGQHFKNFAIVPMAANLQMVLFKSQRGRHYVRFDLNERPIPLMPNDERIYIPWSEARDYMVRCLPLYEQP